MLLSESARPKAVREHPWAPWLAVASVCVGSFMGQLDASIVTLAFPAIQREYHAPLAAAEWVSLAYLLALVGLLAGVGRLADMVGRKLMYLQGFVVFTLASAACGLAPSLQLLVVFRVVQAVGAAMLQANSVALVTTSVPRAKMRQALGLQAAAQALGLALGPTAGGLLVASAGWRSVFWINVPVGCAAVVAGRYLLPRTRERAAMRGFDWPGLLLLATATTGTLLAISGVSGLNLADGVVIGLPIAAACAVAGFWHREHRAAAPLVDPVVLRSPVVAAGLVGALCGYLVLFAPLALMPQILPGGAAHAGLILTALPGGFAVAALSADRVVSPRWGNRRRAVAGAAVATAALALMILAPTSTAPLVVLLALLGMGLGVFIPANNTIIMAALPVRMSATAGGMVNITRGVGTALGIAFVALALHLAGHGTTGARVALLVTVAAALVATACGVIARAKPANAAPPTPPSQATMTGMSTFDQPVAATRGSTAAGPPLADTIARLRRAMRRAARAADPANPLAVAQLELLSAVADEPGVRPGRLARSLKLAANSVTTLVNGLSAKGLITRTAGDTDARAVNLALTTGGQEAVASWQATNGSIIQAALATLGPAHRRALDDALPALHELANAVDAIADAPPGDSPDGTSTVSPPRHH